MESENVMLPGGAIFTRQGGWISNKRRKTRQTESITAPAVTNSTSMQSSGGSPNRADVKAKNFVFVEAVDFPAAQSVSMTTRRKLERVTSPNLAGKMVTFCRKQIGKSEEQPKSKAVFLYPSPSGKKHGIIGLNSSRPLRRRDGLHMILSPQLDAFGSSIGVSTYEWPIPMSARSLRILDRYLSHITPHLFPLSRILNSTTAISGQSMSTSPWFHYAIADPATLHGMLYAGSLYLALQNGKISSNDMLWHSSRAVSIIRSRLLSSPQPVADSTLGALSCLALGEALAGNKDVWHTHMLGLQSLISSTPSGFAMADLPSLLVTKLRRADICGAVETVSSPYFPSTISLLPPVWRVLPLQTITRTRETLHRMFVDANISPCLSISISDLALCSQTIFQTRHQAVDSDTHPVGMAIDPQAFTECTYGIYHSLLSYSDPESTPFTPSLVSTEGLRKSRMLGEALKLAGILYLKTLLCEYPKSINGDSFLISSLKGAIDGLKDLSRHNAATKPAPLTGKNSSNKFDYHQASINTATSNDLSKEQNRETIKLLNWILTLGAICDGLQNRSWWVERLNALQFAAHQAREGNESSSERTESYDFTDNGNVTLEGYLGLKELLGRRYLAFVNSSAGVPDEGRVR